MTLELVDAIPGKISSKSICSSQPVSVGNVSLSFSVLPSAKTKYHNLKSAVFHYFVVFLFYYFLLILKEIWIINLYLIEYRTHKILRQLKSKLKLNVVWEGRMTHSVFTLTAFHWRWHSRRS